MLLEFREQRQKLSCPAECQATTWAAQKAHSPRDGKDTDKAATQRAMHETSAQRKHSARKLQLTGLLYLCLMTPITIPAMIKCYVLLILISIMLYGRLIPVYLKENS